MHIIIEEHQYDADKVDGILGGISNLRNVNDKVSVNYVGYFYNPTLKDCVFILPKVLMEGEMVFGHCTPEEILHLESAENLTKEEHDFIYELSVWIYRSIVVFNEQNPNNDIVLRQYVQQMSKGRLHKSNTLLDILLAMLKFNRENQNFFFFILRNIHSGFNKINWTRTIAHSTAFLQDGSPVYLNPVNKKKQINFDEELIVIFYSILNYISSHYGFPVNINMNFPLITGEKFEHYRKGFGRTRLLQIKYKYFSDKALYLWDLCYAFFDQTKKINTETDDKEYLLVKNFNIIFEAIIDDLIADKNIPTALKEQEDGKRVDHIYQYRDLALSNDEKPDDKTIYYIGDSKYYKRGNEVGKESVYKQFTYARNVIQWNLDLFNDGSEAEQQGHVKLRDDITEGYNIIPNFFISAQQKNLKSEDDIHLTDNDNKFFSQRQFDNRLFDRDTFLIAHYDVNFLFVVALYGRNHFGEKAAWKKKVRNMFREEIQKMLKEKFTFYAMTPHADVDSSLYIQDHFQQLIGKVFTPFEDRGSQKYYSLALDKDTKFEQENAALLNQLEDSFFICKCNLGELPYDKLEEVEKVIPIKKVDKFLTFHFLEKYANNKILIGSYHDEAHFKWITGDNDKGTLIYNVRLDKNRAGHQIKAQLLRYSAQIAILFQEKHEHENAYRVFHVHHHAIIKEERMKLTRYPREPQGDYFCYVFDEEISVGKLDFPELIKHGREVMRAEKSDYENYEPIYLDGKEILKYRKSLY